MTRAVEMGDPFVVLLDATKAQRALLPIRRFWAHGPTRILLRTLVLRSLPDQRGAGNEMMIPPITS